MRPLLRPTLHAGSRLAPSLLAAAAAACRTAPPHGLDASIAALEPALDAAALADAGVASALGVHVMRAGSLRPRSAADEAGVTIAIAAASFEAGSTPGDEGRDPTLEPANVVVTLGPFAIDALPFPNDPKRPPALARSRDDAERACAGLGARLCSELEWERACRGPDGDPYASGAAWDPACDADPDACTSAFGVRAMGGLREWTASNVTADGVTEPVLRGPGVEGPRVPAAAHRCAHRSRARAAAGTAGFRCCHGPPNDAAIAITSDASRPAFVPIELDIAALAAAFARAPTLSRLGPELHLFDDRDPSPAARAPDALARASFAPIAWSPEAGSDLVVAAGRAGKSSFIVALWPIRRGGYRVAASYLFVDDPVLVTLAFDPRRRRELTWTARSSSDPASLQTGHVRVREDHAIAIDPL